MRPKFYSTEAVQEFVKQYGEEALIQLEHSPGTLSRTEKGHIAATRKIQRLKSWPKQARVMAGIVLPPIVSLALAYVARKLGL